MWNGSTPRFKPSSKCCRCPRARNRQLPRSLLNQIRSITASPLLSPCQSTRLLWKRLCLSTQQPVISNKPGKWVRWTRKRFLASVAAVSAALNGVSGMSDMTGKAARLRGRAQLELLRYHAPAFIERNHFLRRVTRVSRWHFHRTGGTAVVGTYVLDLRKTSRFASHPAVNM